VWRIGYGISKEDRSGDKDKDREKSRERKREREREMRDEDVCKIQASFQ
jgi:hypothetical protein